MCFSSESLQRDPSLGFVAGFVARDVHSLEEVRSRLGEGTTFVVRLPLGDRPSLSEQPAAPSSDVPVVH